MMSANAQSSFYALKVGPPHNPPRRLDCGFGIASETVWGPDADPIEYYPIGEVKLRRLGTEVGLQWYERFGPRAGNDRILPRGAVWQQSRPPPALLRTSPEEDPF
jgi:hypothetical protein